MALIHGTTQPPKASPHDPIYGRPQPDRSRENVNTGVDGDAAWPDNMVFILNCVQGERVTATAATTASRSTYMHRRLKSLPAARAALVMPTVFRALARRVALLAVVGVLAACGGGGDSEDTAVGAAAPLGREARAAEAGVAASATQPAIAVGDHHACALTNAGGVKCWGRNSAGQLGNGSLIDSLTPVDVSGLGSGVVAISAGEAHTCALISGGGVKCWGANAAGQVGDGSLDDRVTPVDVSGLSSGVSAITAGFEHTCALTSTGGVKCWGWNSYHQLGDGSIDNKATPVDVSGLSSGVSAISAGFAHTCAVTSAGGAKCWGVNHTGQLGNGSFVHSSIPVDVMGLSEARAIVAGYSHTCALTSAGGAKCWGNNTGFELGNGSTYDNHPTPLDVIGLSSGLSAIDLGSAYTCALTITGGVKCWGSNYLGVLGRGLWHGIDGPEDVTGLSSGVSAIAAARGFVCALLTTGGVKCWGSNLYGQLGDGSYNDSGFPVDVVGLNLGGSGTGNNTDTDGDGIPNDIDNCPTVANPDQIDVNGDGFGDGCVDPGVSIPASADIDPTVSIGLGTTIAKNVTVGAYTKIGSYSSLDQSAIIGAYVTIGSYVKIDQYVWIGDRASIGDGTVIGQYVVICAGAKLGSNVVIGRNVLVQTNAVVADGARLSVPKIAAAPSPSQCNAN